MVSSKFYYTAAAVIGLCLVLVSVTETAAMPSIPRYRAYYNDPEEPSAETLLQLMARLRQTLMRAQDEFENSKRTVDFGLARGYSGAQEAKHRLGLAAANYAGGPGRRRRSETEA